MADLRQSNYRIITVNNWGVYQTEGRPTGRPRADQGQTEGKPRATDKEYKEYKELKESKEVEEGKDKKHIYGEYRHVRLTDREMDRLVNDYGEQETHAAIKYLDEYKQRKPYKSKDDNLTLRKWVFDAVKEDKARGQPQETIFDAWAKA